MNPSVENLGAGKKALMFCPRSESALPGEENHGHAPAFFFRSAQRFFIASPILLRAAADKRRLRPIGLARGCRTRLFWLP